MYHRRNVQFEGHLQRQNRNSRPKEDPGVSCGAFLSMRVTFVSSTIGFPPDSDWPRLSYLRQKDFKKLGEHNILRSKVKTTDSTALDLIEVLFSFLNLANILYFRATSTI